MPSSSHLAALLVCSCDGRRNRGCRAANRRCRRRCRVGRVQQVRLSQRAGRRCSVLHCGHPRPASTTAASRSLRPLPRTLVAAARFVRSPPPSVCAPASHHLAAASQAPRWSHLSCGRWWRTPPPAASSPATGPPCAPCWRRCSQQPWPRRQKRSSGDTRCAAQPLVRCEEVTEVTPTCSQTTGPHRQADPAPLVALLEAFEDEPPFTVQRLCELLLDPTRHYSRLAALEHALCKLLYVTSTAPCGPKAAAAAAARAASRARGSGGTPPFGAALGGDSPGSPGGGLIEPPRREEPPPSEFALEGL